MADKQEDRGTDDGQEKRRQFIHEKIVRQPPTRRQIIVRIFKTGFYGMVFGAAAAVCFAVVKPAAEKLLGTEETEPDPITIAKDEPDATQSAESETKAASEETEPVEDMVRSEMEKYPYSMDDLNRLYGNLHDLIQEWEGGVVSVHSIQREMDWFDNPIETTGQYSGVVIARTRGEILILVPDEAVATADSIEVSFSDGTILPGAVKQKDSVAGMALVSVNGAQMEDRQYDHVKAIALGNSYSVKQGDLVAAIGSPAGVTGSSGYGFISYVVRSAKAVDGSTRIFYTDTPGDARAGTFLLNTDGELIGWAAEGYSLDDSGRMTSVMSVSDYKGALELMSNGLPVPYFGIQGQEITAAMAQSGMPKGIYITEAVADSPAYNAGLQPGDILTKLGKTSVTTLKELQSQVEKLQAGTKISVSVQRSNGKDEYREIIFEVTVGTR